MSQPERPTTWHEDVRRVEEKITAVQLIVEGLSNRVMSRAEIEQDLAAHVPIDTFNAELRGVDERITRIESAPTRQLAIIGAVVGCLGLALTGLSIAIGVIIWIVAHYHG